MDNQIAVAICYNNDCKILNCLRELLHMDMRVSLIVLLLLSAAVHNHIRHPGVCNSIINTEVLVIVRL